MRVITTIGLIAWGALAFGAPYPWAYWPLFALCLTAGTIGLIRGRGSLSSLSGLAAALAGASVVVSLQLVPLQATTIRAISPGTDVFLRQYAMTYGSADSMHSLSIDPASTTLALAALIALSIFLLGTARSLTARDARRIAAGIAGIGMLMSVVGIVQAATWNGKLYGFWQPEQAGTAFGPFNNHNHFAGWMLMAIPVVVGYLCGRLTGEAPQVKSGWRQRMLWLGSAEANQIMLIGFAILIMSMALVLTRSRSGLIGFVTAMAISGWSVIRKPSTSVSRRGIAAYLLFVVIVAVAWTGVDQLAPSFSSDKMATLGLRLPAWGDAIRIARRFALVGSGLNTYGVTTSFYQTVDLSVHYGEAHNDYLQLLAEGGVLLALPVAAALTAAALLIRRRFRDARDSRMDEWVRRGATTGLLAIALQETADFSLQMPGNAVMCTVLIALAVRGASR